MDACAELGFARSRMRYNGPVTNRHRPDTIDAQFQKMGVDIVTLEYGMFELLPLKTENCE
jgi:hypothetical protein